MLSERLSMVSGHPRYAPAVLARPAPAADGTVPPVPPPVIVEELAEQSRSRPPEPLAVDGREQPLAGGADGLAALRPEDFIGAPADPAGAAAPRRGLRALEPVGEVRIVAVPDIHLQPAPLPPRAPEPPHAPDPCLPAELTAIASPPPTGPAELPPAFGIDDIYRVQAALVQHCEEQRDRVALLEPPLEAVAAAGRGIDPILAWRGRFDSSFAGFYAPWPRVADPLGASGLTLPVPPSGHVAGQYARADLEHGVHVAPANAPLAWVQDVTEELDDAAHGLLNAAGVNLLRPLAGRGIRIMGARTTSSDPTWRYVNVRRLLLMIETAVELATQWSVFQPHDALTRTRLQLSLTSFLTALWQRGALVGDIPEAAFAVRCDQETNPPAERALGRLLAEVRVAPASPFEFIVVRVGRTRDELQATDPSPSTGGP